MKTWDVQPVLSLDQVRKIERALKQARGNQGFTEDEFILAVSLCERIILSCQELSGVFSGHTGIDVQNDSLIFYSKGKG